MLTICLKIHSICRLITVIRRLIHGINRLSIAFFNYGWHSRLISCIIGLIRQALAKGVSDNKQCALDMENHGKSWL